MLAMLTPLVFKILDFKSNETPLNFDNIINLFILFIDPFVSGSLTLITVSLKQETHFSVLKSTHQTDKLLRKLDIEVAFALSQKLFIGYVVAMAAGYMLWAIYLLISGMSVIDELMERFAYMICFMQLTVVLCFYIGSLLNVFLR